MRIRAKAPCPCGSGRKYKHCCRRFHDGQPPPSALDLMRARYSAYATGRADFIMATMHPDNPDRQVDPIAWAEEILTFCRLTEFRGLSILASEPGEARSYVTFRAELRQPGGDASFTERSAFERSEGGWRYLGQTDLDSS